MSFEAQWLEMAKKQEGAFAKAVASYIFREVIEEAHCKYNIAQKDMEEMCRTAVNRAALLESIIDDKPMRDAFLMHAINGLEWDMPTETEDISDMRKLLREFADMAADN